MEQAQPVEMMKEAVPIQPDTPIMQEQAAIADPTTKTTFDCRISGCDADLGMKCCEKGARTGKCGNAFSPCGR